MYVINQNQQKEDSYLSVTFHQTVSVLGTNNKNNIAS